MCGINKTPQFPFLSYLGIKDRHLVNQSFGKDDVYSLNSQPSTQTKQNLENLYVKILTHQAPATAKM